jgi:hypothetical protein
VDVNGLHPIMGFVNCVHSTVMNNTLITNDLARMQKEVLQQYFLVATVRKTIKTLSLFFRLRFKPGRSQI